MNHIATAKVTHYKLFRLPSTSSSLNHRTLPSILPQDGNYMSCPPEGKQRIKTTKPPIIGDGSFRNNRRNRKWFNDDEVDGSLNNL
jgi:hypothetical protein